MKILHETNFGRRGRVTLGYANEPLASHARTLVGKIGPGNDP
jgi:hypothetical protein